MHFVIVHSKVFAACMGCISSIVYGCFVNDGERAVAENCAHDKSADSLVVAAYHALAHDDDDAQLYIGRPRCLGKNWHQNMAGQDGS
jgi:hypothetical protein